MSLHKEHYSHEWLTERIARPRPLQILASQRSLHNAPIFRLLLKVAVKGTHQCDLQFFGGTPGFQQLEWETYLETKEKMLVKSNDEFTSLIQKVYKVQEEYIIITENSIYLVSGKIQKRRIQAPALRDS